MGEEVVGERLRDAPADDVDAALAIGEKGGGTVEFGGFHLRERLAQVGHDRVGEAVEDVRARCLGRPAVVFADRVRQGGFQLVVEACLEIREAAKTELLHHAGDGRRRHAGVFRHRGDAAEAGDGIVVEQRRGQLLFGAGQRIEMGTDHIRHRHGCLVERQIVPLRFGLCRSFGNKARCHNSSQMFF